MTSSFKIINKHLMATRRHSNGHWEIGPNIFETAKAWVIADAYGRLAGFLPYSVPDLGWPSMPDDWTQRLWPVALRRDNPPGRFDPRINPDRFRELVEPLDFSKPYDDAVADRIRVEFMGGARAAIAVDADQIEIGDGEA